MGIETINIKNNNGAQAIRIPKKMRINDDKAYLKKVGNTLYVIPFHDPWQNLIESTDMFTSDFMDERNQPIQQQVIAPDEVNSDIEITPVVKLLKGSFKAPVDFDYKLELEKGLTEKYQ